MTGSNPEGADDSDDDDSEMNRWRQGNYTNELTVDVTTCTRPVQDEARQKSHME